MQGRDVLANAPFATPRMELTIYCWIYLLTAVVTMFAGTLVMQRRAMVGALELALLCFSAAVCAFFLAFEAADLTPEGKVFWTKLSYIGGVFIPVFFLLFALRFTAMTRLKELKAAWFLFVFPLISLGMAFTNEHHHWLWAGFAPINPTTNMMVYYHGFWFWVGFTLYNYVLLFVATYKLIAFSATNRQYAQYRQQAFLILVAGLLPWVASVVYLLNIGPIEGMELTTISTSFSTSFFAWALLKGRLLKMVPVARETLMETLPIGVVALDHRDRLQDMNQLAREYLKLSKTDLLGMTLGEACAQYGDTNCQDAARLVEALLDKGPSTSTTVAIGSGDIILRINRCPIQAAPGSRLITFQDITREVGVQEELKSAKQKAEESDRLKSAFLANMSHEIRTPMNSIIGFVTLLQEENLSAAETSEYLDIVRKNGDRLLSTLNDIVDISKVEAGQAVVNLTVFDINEVLLNCYGLYRHDASIKGLDFKRPDLLPPDEAYVRTDKEKVYSIVTNLVKNALKYTQKGFVAMHCSIANDELCFSVTDSGIGIPREKQQAIFERFVQVDSDRKTTFEGAGLGLSITKAFVELLGGVITVESEEGKGSSFFVRIPVEPASPQQLE